MAVTIGAASAGDVGAIARIYNEGIAGRGATFETALRSEEDIAGWLADAGRYPVLVARAEDGRVVGWARIGSYRPRACYAGIGEVSVYIDGEARGQGVGRRLLNALIDSAEAHGFWKLLSRIFPFNTASRALVRSCGFREVGTYENHASLDGQWLDVVIVERLIPANLK